MHVNTNETPLDSNKMANVKISKLIRTDTTLDLSQKAEKRLKLKFLTISSIGEDMEQLELLYIADSCVNGTSFWEKLGQLFLKTLNTL